MSLLDGIVTVNISVQTDTVARASFGVPAIMSQFLTSKTTPAFDRARSYASLSEMAAEGWLPADNVYKMANAIFSQNPRPARLVVGRRDTTDADWATALNAIQVADDSWYMLSIVPVTAAGTENLQVAAWTESANKLFFAQTTDATVLAAGSGDEGSGLKALKYLRTASMYHATANISEFAQAAWVGEGAPWEPGSSSWAYKTLRSVTPDALNSSQRSVAQGKNVNTYCTIAGQSITQKGVVASGEWIDVVIGIDWLKARLQEAAYSAFVQNRKVAFDDGGITAMAGIVQSILEEAGRKGILQSDSIVLTVPRYKDISAADKGTRNLSNVKFTAKLKGAIHLLAINGTVSV